MDRLAEYLKGKPNLDLLLTSLGVRYVALTTVGGQLDTLRRIANATGAQLDVIGAIVGQAREGTDDATFARLIQARILSNRSSGTVEEVYAVAALALPLGSAFHMTDAFPAGFNFYLDTPELATADAYRTIRFISGARAAAVRGLFFWRTAAVLNTFTLDSSVSGTPSRTNYALYSNDLSHTPEWGTFASSSSIAVTGNVTADPGGNNEGARIDCGSCTSGQACQVYQDVSGDAASHTFSLYLRAATPMTVYMWIYNGSSNSAPTYCNLTTSWQRFSVTHSAGSVYRCHVGNNRFGLAGSLDTPAQSFFGWGGQFESGSSPTGFISTTSAPQTTPATSSTQALDAGIFANAALYPGAS